MRAPNCTVFRFHKAWLHHCSWPPEEFRGDSGAPGVAEQVHTLISTHVGTSLSPVPTTPQVALGFLFLEVWVSLSVFPEPHKVTSCGSLGWGGEHRAGAGCVSGKECRCSWVCAQRCLSLQMADGSGKSLAQPRTCLGSRNSPES